MTTITAPRPDTVVAPESPPAESTGFATAAVQSARRTVLQFVRTPQLVIMGSIIGALFLFMFRYIFGGAIDAGGVSYVDYLVPGFVVTAILWIGMNAPAGVAEDAASGLHDRLRSLPIPRAAVMVGRSLADTALTTWGMLVTAAVGVAVGFRIDASVAELLAAIALLLIATYAFSWLFITIGLVAGGAQASQAMATLVVVPLTFISSAYVPAASLPGWMQPIADNQPLTVISNAVRSLTLGGTDAAGARHRTAYWVVLSLVWCAAILTVFGTLAVTRFARRR